jgi:tRNA-2-methylthio-N6-dimethylallyladenosine synthase
VLNAMKRGYTALEYKNIIKRVRAVRPDICLSSDFIVGFPGETEADFEQTMKLIIDLNFDTSFSFVYSRRPGTPAADLSDNTTDAIKLARLQRLQAQIILNAKAISLAMLGSTQTILVEGLSKKNEHELMGRTENMRIVNFSGHKRLIGQMVPVRIIDVQPNSLRGEIVI